MTYARALPTVTGALIGLVILPASMSAQQPQGTENPVARLFPKVDRFGDPLPAGGLARLGTERFRHWFPGHVVYSPDGKILASLTHLRYSSNSEQQFAILWDAATGKKLLHIADVDSLAFSPDSKTVAVVRGFALGKQTLAKGSTSNPIRVLELPSGREKFRLPADACPPLAFSQAGDLVTAGYDGRIRVWNAADGAVLKAFPFEGKELSVLGVSAKGQEISTVDIDFILRVYDSKSGNKVREVAMGQPGKDNRRDVFEPSPLITPDGRFYCDTGFEYFRLTKDSVGRKNVLRVWDLATGKEVAHLPGVMRPLPSTGQKSGFAIFSIALSNNGKTLAYGQSFNVTTIVDVASGKARDFKRTDGGEDVGVAFSPDGKTLAAADAHCHTLHFWDVESAMEKADPTVHAGPIFALAVSPNEQLIATGGRDGTIRLWDQAKGEFLHTFRGPQGDVKGICFSPDGKQLASIHHEGLVCFWDLAKRMEKKDLRKTAEFGPGSVVNYIFGGDSIAALLREPVNDLDPRQKQMALFTAKAVLHVWQPTTGKEKTAQPLDAPLTFAKAGVSRDGHWIAIGSGKAVVLCKTTTGQNWKLEHEHLAKIDRVAFSHDAKLLGASDGSQIHLFSTESRKYLRSVQRPGVKLRELAFSPDGRYLMGTYYVDNKSLKTNFQLWELASETPVLDFSTAFHHQSAMVFAADGKTLFAADGATSALIWGLEPASWRKTPPTSFDDKGLAQAWEHLAALDGAAGYEAVWYLSAAGNKTVNFFKKQLTAAGAFSEEHFAKLLKDLDAAEFKVREAAMAELRRLGPQVEGELRRAAAKPASLEAGRRLQTLLAELAEPMRAPAALRQLRAVEVLERIATPEARQLLKKLAGGLSEARLTHEAAKAMRRLDGKLLPD